MPTNKFIKHFLLFFLMFTTSVAQAQVGIGTATPTASAQLDVTSTTKGFLPPRMTTSDRDAIVSPAAGLIIYNTTISGLQIYSGSTWYTASAATTMGAIAGSSAANGGTITAGVLSLAPADATNAGIVTTGAQTFAGNKTFNGNVGIGTATPPAKLSILAGPSEPSIPGTSSAGVFRIGVTSNEGMDFGKSSMPPFSGWIQNGYDATVADPLSLNPLGGNVGIGTMTPAASAQLDVNSTTKGLLPPRMTGAQRNSIPGPVAGLVVFCTDCGAGVIQVYNGSFWTDLKGGAATINNLAVGQRYQGGIIAYILQPGDPGYDASVPHGIIAAPSDQSTAIQWYNGSYVITSATGTAIGTGNANTNTIVSVQGAGSYAAKLCSDLLNEYSDWYLPSKDELNKLYINQALVGGFANFSYWSSTEDGTNNAWRQNFNNGVQTSATKSNALYVRAVRAF